MRKKNEISGKFSLKWMAKKGSGRAYSCETSSPWRQSGVQMLESNFQEINFHSISPTNCVDKIIVYGTGFSFSSSFHPTIPTWLNKELGELWIYAFIYVKAHHWNDTIQHNHFALEREHTNPSNAEKMLLVLMKACLLWENSTLPHHKEMSSHFHWHSFRSIIFTMVFARNLERKFGHSNGMRFVFMRKLD